MGKRSSTGTLSSHNVSFSIASAIVLVPAHVRVLLCTKLSLNAMHKFIFEYMHVATDDNEEYIPRGVGRHGQSRSIKQDTHIYYI